MERAAQRTKPVTPERAVREESNIRVGLPQHGLHRGAYWGNQAALRRLTRTAPHLQRRLEVGVVNDPLEAEADCAADDVMRMPNPLASVRSVPPLVSRTCDNCEDEKLHAKPDGTRTHGGQAPAIVHQVLETTGQPLAPAMRDFMEPRFGRSFEQVRVHADSRAVESAEAVQAKAYAVGSHVVFGRGQFRESTSEGRSLLAHELSHVLQQDGGTQIIRRAPDKDEEEKKRKLANRKMARKKAAPYQYPPMLNPPIDLTASVYQGLRAQGMLTQEELDKQTEDLKDPELKKLQEEEKKAAKARQVKQDDDDATRHDRFMGLRKSIYRYGFSQKQLQCILEEKFSARDFSVLKKFGLTQPSFGRRNHWGDDVIQAINKHDEDWQKKNGATGPIARALTDEDIKAQANLEKYAYREDVLGAMENGPAAAVGYHFGGNAGAMLGAIADNMAQAASGLLDGRGGTSNESSLPAKDPAAIIEPMVPEPAAPTPDKVFEPAPKDTTHVDPPAAPPASIETKAPVDPVVIPPAVELADDPVADTTPDTNDSAAPAPKRPPAPVRTPRKPGLKLPRPPKAGNPNTARKPNRKKNLPIDLKRAIREKNRLENTKSGLSNASREKAAAEHGELSAKDRLEAAKAQLKATPKPEDVVAIEMEILKVKDLNDRLDLVRDYRNSRDNWSPGARAWLDQQAELLDAQLALEASRFGKEKEGENVRDTTIQIPVRKQELGTASKSVADLARVDGKNYRRKSSLAYDEILGKEATQALKARRGKGAGNLRFHTDHIVPVREIRDMVIDSGLLELHAKASPAQKAEIEKAIQNLGDIRENLVRMEEGANLKKSDRSWDDISYGEVEEIYTPEMVNEMRAREAEQRANIRKMIKDHVAHFSN